MRSDLAQSYGQDRLPRYTSYPTAPHFSPAIGEQNYRSWLKSMPVREPASIYLHVPFCRSMCWYCGCHTSVTKRDEPIATYAAGLRTEAQSVAESGVHVVFEVRVRVDEAREDDGLLVVDRVSELLTWTDPGDRAGLVVDLDRAVADRGALDRHHPVGGEHRHKPASA